MHLYKCTIQYLPYGERSPGQKRHSSADLQEKKKKKVSKKQGMFLLVLYPQMRSFLPHQLTGRQGGETGLSGCIEDFFFPFGPVVLTGSQKTALRAIR